MRRWTLDARRLRHWAEAARPFAPWSPQTALGVSGHIDPSSPAKEGTVALLVVSGGSGYGLLGQRGALDLVADAAVANADDPVAGRADLGVVCHQNDRLAVLAI